MLLKKIQSIYFQLVDQYYKYNIDSVYSRSWAMFLFTLVSIVYSSFTACYDTKDESLLEYDMFEYLGRNNWLDRQAIYSQQAAAGLTGALGFGSMVILMSIYAFRFFKIEDVDISILFATRKLINILTPNIVTNDSAFDENGSLNVTTITNFKDLIESSTYLVDRVYDFGRDLNGNFFSLNSLFDINNTNIGQAGVIDSVAPASAELRGILELYHLVMYILYLVSFTLVVLATASLNQYTNKASKVFNNKFTYGYELYRVAYGALLASQLNPSEDPYNDEEMFQTFENHVNCVADNVAVFKRNIVAAEGTVYWVYHSYIEFVWTLIPCLALLFISLPSFTLALALDEAHKPSDWIKVIGNQWFWVYEYSTYEDDIVIFSNIVQGDELSSASNNSRALRMLEVDNSITIRANKFTRFLITSTDVIHSWAVPALGVKVDACPGRIATVTILPTRLGVFYGQCSEICGVNHGFMPICVEVVA